MKHVAVAAILAVSLLGNAYGQVTELVVPGGDFEPPGQCSMFWNGFESGLPNNNTAGAYCIDTDDTWDNGNPLYGERKAMIQSSGNINQTGFLISNPGNHYRISYDVMPIMHSASTDCPGAPGPCWPDYNYSVRVDVDDTPVIFQNTYTNPAMLPLSVAEAFDIQACAANPESCDTYTWEDAWVHVELEGFVPKDLLGFISIKFQLEGPPPLAGIVIDNVRLEYYPPAPACTGDLDGDGDVDPADLAVLLGNWGACE